MEAIQLAKYRGKPALVTNDTESRGVYILMLDGGEECPARWALQTVTPQSKMDALETLRKIIQGHGALLEACELMWGELDIAQDENRQPKFSLNEIRLITTAIAKAKGE